jgi:SAM-dependent methyltransferase
MQFEDLRRHWNRFGQTDPLWAVLTDPSKRRGKWDPDAFFKTGRDEIAGVLARVRALGLNPGTGAALDFGCGVGRLTQALADHFDRATGVDVAASMIDHARTFNRHGDRCTYVLNEAPHLGRFDAASFDFVYSHIALQHMLGEYAAGYMREFVRVLRPGGIAVFDMPAEHVPTAPGPRGLKRTVRGAIRATLNAAWRLFTGSPLFPTMEMHTLPRARVEALVTEAGGHVVDATPDTSGGTDWHGYVYTVVKSPTPATTPSNPRLSTTS